MWFLPYESVILESPLSRQEVLDKLDSVVESRKRFRSPFSRNHKPYEGEVSGDRFKVSRIIHYQSSFLPIIKGEITSGYPGSSIKLVMHPPPATIILGVIQLGVMVFVIAFMIPRCKDPTVECVNSYTLLGSVFAFIYLFFMVGFKPKAAKSLKFFRELFDAT